MTLTLTINGVDKSSLLEAGSLTISEAADGRNVLVFTTIDRTGAYLVDEGVEVIVEDDAVRLFGGYVTDVDQESVLQSSGTYAIRCSCQANDYNELVDRHLAVELWDDTNAGDIAAQIVDSYLKQDGVSCGYDYATTQESGVVAYWPMTEATGDGIDTVGGRDIAWSGSPTYESPLGLFGDPGGCMELDGSTQYGTVPYNAALKPTTFTVEFWCEIDSTGTQIVYDTRNDSKGWLVYITSNKVRLQNGTGTSIETSAGAVPVDTLCHVVAVYDGDSGFIYVNNVLKKADTALAITAATAGDITIGKSALSSSSYVNGEIGRLALYNEAKTAEWIGDRYSIGTTGVGGDYAQGTIAPGFALSRVIANYSPVGETLNYLRDTTGLSWNIAYDKSLRLFDRDQYAAPTSFTDAGDTFSKLKVKKQRDNYRNVEYLRGGLYRSDARVETFSGDDETQTFVTAYPVDAAPTITLNAAAQTVGIKGVDESKDWYWNRGENTIVQEDGDTPLSSADVLSVTYYGLSPLLAVSRLEDEITARAAIDGTSGIFEHLYEEADIDEQDMAVEKATGLLRRYGQSSTQIEFETNASINADCVSMSAGQVIPVSVTAHGLSGQFFVESVKKTYRAVDDVLVVTGIANSNENLGSWVEFFRRLHEKSDKNTVRDSEILLRLRDFRGQVAVADTETATSAAIETPEVAWTGSLPAASYAALVTDDAPVAYWRMDEASGNLADEISGRAATVSGNPTYEVAGALEDDDNTAIDLDGSGDYFSVAYDADLNPAQFSLEAWFYRDVDTGGSERIIDTAASNKGFRMSIHPTTDVLFASLGDGSALSNTSGITATQTGQWYHGVITYDGATVRIYLNGSLENSAADGYSVNTSADMRIGGLLAGGESFNGKLDEIAVYDRALDAQEVYDHFSMGRAGTAQYKVGFSQVRT